MAPTEAVAAPRAAWRYPSPSDEDLVDLASLAYRTAMASCGGCRDYHITWPWLRAAGINGNGPEVGWAVTCARIVAELGGRAEVRWGIAGAADAGVLAVARACAARLGDAGHTFTVVDRCPTPLALCRRYAEGAGIDVETAERELLEFDAGAAFDAVLIHHTLDFFDREGRARLLERVRRWLAPAGRLFLWTAHRTPETDHAAYKARVEAWRLEVLRGETESGALALPEDVATFARRLQGRDGFRPPRSGSEWRLDDLVTTLADVGFGSIDTVPIERDPETLALFGGPPKPRRLIVAA